MGRKHKADPCVCRLGKDGEAITNLCVHLDGTIVGESEVCNALHVSLLQEFQATQGNLSWCHGI